MTAHLPLKSPQFHRVSLQILIATVSRCPMLIVLHPGLVVAPPPPRQPGERCTHQAIMYPSCCAFLQFSFCRASCEVLSSQIN